MVAVLVATVAAAALVLLCVAGTTQSKVFSDQIAYKIWGILAIGFVGASWAGAAYSTPARRHLNDLASCPARAISYVVALLIILFAASPQLMVRLSLQHPSPLDGGLFREIALGFLVLVPTLRVLSGLVLAALLLSQEKLPWDSTSGRGFDIREMLRIRAHLHLFLAVVALVIGGSILVIAAFRVALLGYAPQPPLYFILPVYGLVMTGLLALLYVPAYLAWRTKAQEVLDAVYPLPHDGRPNHDWYIGRADLEGLLNLKMNAATAFATGLGLLTPLASSLISALIPSLTKAPP